MNSAALPTIESPPEELLNNVRRTYRRICLLRATGRHSEALDLEIEELSHLLAATHDAGVAQHRTAAAMTEESARVTEAATPAEVLAPLLAEKLRDSSASAPASSVPRPATATASPAPSVPSSSSAASRPTPPSGSPSVTDLLDGMFALESPHRASHPAR